MVRSAKVNIWCDTSDIRTFTGSPKNQILNTGCVGVDEMDNYSNVSHPDAGRFAMNNFLGLTTKITITELHNVN